MTLIRPRPPINEARPFDLDRRRLVIQIFSSWTLIFTIYTSPYKLQKTIARYDLSNESLFTNKFEI